MFLMIYLHHREHYNVELKEIQVGDDVLQLPKDFFGVGTNQGTIIDSGTTLAYLPDLAYKQLIKKINAAQPNLKSHIVDQQFTCYKYSGNVEKGFPVVTFHFKNSLSMKVYPHQYLFEVEDQEWCIGFQDSNLQTKDGKEITLLGGSSTIKVKDEESRKVYTVRGDKLSHSSRVHTSSGISIACFFFVMSITFNNPRLN
uniref:Peptidase A1 domain-containing protein n=1 Tax=Lactuca sativa TaxID=4236 RepID=A0A9R1UKW8_LACSA|nr:hypothetical protein LSAT_V11C800388880 [Lactuca sativa]